MVNLRDELVKAIMANLKINQDPFTIGSIKKKLETIPDSKLQNFYDSLFGDEHSFLNGMDRVTKVAKQFQVQTVDKTEIKAKELISLVHTMNNVVFENSRASGRSFDEELKGTRFTNVTDRVIAVLDNVHPHYNHKKLIGNIRSYADSVAELVAFKRALQSVRNDNAIENKSVRKLLKKTA